jgi:hypothetical protein
MIHNHASLDLVRDRQAQMIEDARLARLAAAHRSAHLASVGGRLRRAASGWRADSTVFRSGMFRRPTTAPCPC